MELVWVKYNSFHHAVALVCVFLNAAVHSMTHIQQGDKGHCGLGRERVARDG